MLAKVRESEGVVELMCYVCCIEGVCTSDIAVIVRVGVRMCAPSQLAGATASGWKVPFGVRQHLRSNLYLSVTVCVTVQL